MAKTKGGFYNRILLGKEKSEDYARGTLPSNRWELFWDILKGRFTKLIGVNLLMILFFLPLFFLLFYRLSLITGYGIKYPFSQSFGVGYQAPISLIGFSESVTFSADALTFMFLPLALIVAGFGIAGGAYVMRNMVWTEGLFVISDFWIGIKQNFKQIIMTMLLFSVVFYVSILAIDVYNQKIAMGDGARWLLVILKVLCYAFLAFSVMIAMHMITLSVTYEYKFLQLLRNAFVISAGLIVRNIFFLVVGAIPLFLVMIDGFFMVLGLILLFVLSLSFLLLVWTNYSQWIYDKFINTRIKGAKRNKGIYEKVKEDSKSKTIDQYKKQLDALSKNSTLGAVKVKPITDDEIKLHELPTSFTRDDLVKLRESKVKIAEANDEYIKEHNEETAVKVEEETTEIKKEMTEMEKRIEKAKAELSKHQSYGKKKHKKKK